jgi:hypothetical protein
MRTFLRVASGLGMGLGIILFLIGLGSLIGKGEGALIGIGLGSMISCALIRLLVDIANAVDDIARKKVVSGTQVATGQTHQSSVSGWYQAPPPRSTPDGQ